MDSTACVCYNLNPDKLFGVETYVIIRETMGILSAGTSAILFIPDLIITCKTKGKQAHTFKFLLLFLLGTVFWLIYGILILSLSTILLEIFLIINIIVMLIIKCIYLSRNGITGHNQNNTPSIEEITSV
tara:strand:+ start:200 stop:586 length:387 start_codon:yes stop_codon:yes gene_type:complete